MGDGVREVTLLCSIGPPIVVQLTKMLESDVEDDEAEFKDWLRSKTGSAPDDIPPAFLMPGEETLLDLFLFYFPLRLITETVTATNANAVTVAWPRDRPWKHLNVGEWMRWLGLWVLMTLYPITGSRRLYWRGSMAFGRYMPERRFEVIL